MHRSLSHIKQALNKPTHIAPLAVFRVLFGAVMLFSIIRFVAYGWVDELYIQPDFYFSYFGFEWIKPLGETGMYTVFGLMGLGFLGIMLGYRYKLSASIAFLAFTYVELIDKTNYLNHYYFVSIITFLMILLPANRYFSLDVLRNKSLKSSHVNNWVRWIIPLQLGIVYFFAGLAKMNADWLLEAMPLQMWLPAKANLPLIGWLLEEEWTAWLFSWSGMLYDLCIPFLLLISATRKWAYIGVVVFHVFTWVLFPIGMFPWIMIASTLVFFPAEFHLKLMARWNKLIRFAKTKRTEEKFLEPTTNWTTSRLVFGIMCIHILVQLCLPFRHELYNGNLFWTEEGYRFSWRVMLMEKAGTAFFYVQDSKTQKEIEVSPREYLTPNQEKMMVTQPDMILQFAHFLAEEFSQKGLSDPAVRVESYVTLNGSGSKLFIDPKRNLAAEKESFAKKDWVIPFETPKALRASIQ